MRLNDKFILMGIDDENSKDIAEILKSKTAKKILDYLSEVKEASEKDISDYLKIPLNTIEYNLKKLIKGGFIVNSKNFFWSVKGKKIPMYKLVNKHIIIGTKKPTLSSLKAILPVIITLIAIIAVIVLLNISLIDKVDRNLDDTKLKKFNSEEELKAFLKENYQGYSGLSTGASLKAAAAESVSAASADSSRIDYSRTNIQVEGVDEADIVKNDGEYLYVVSNNKVFIVNAYPAENMEIVSELEFKDENVGNIFVNEDKLIIFSNRYSYSGCRGDVCIAENTLTGKSVIEYPYYSTSETIVNIYDISNRNFPYLVNDISIEGNYIDSRMINDYIYLISNKNINIENPEPPIYYMNGVKNSIAIPEIYYFDYPDNNYYFTTISAININDGSLNLKTYLTGYSGTIYVSQDNIYISYQKTLQNKDYSERFVNEIIYPILPDVQDEEIKKIIESNDPYYEKINKINKVVYEHSLSLKGDEKDEFDKKFEELIKEFNEKIAKERDKTIIHKININNEKINYVTFGEVPGKVLNQFSMDEYENKFRIATTTGEIWEGNSLNHLYVLDEDLNIIGKVEDLAHGERIYSARFIGNRAYMVTFKKVDPFFAIDLTYPENPKVLGILKIPGYSDYLHPYDEKHVIGIGKEAVGASEEEVQGRNLDFAWYQGIKISLFDVTDVEAPKEITKFNIGDRGTDSEALNEHKAFLFDKEKELLVLPISLAEIDRNKYRECNKDELKSPNSYNYCLTPYTYGAQVWNGVYVLNINLKDGITLKGKITHLDEELSGLVGEKYYYPSYGSQIRRSAYIDNVLYTISMNKIKANDLANIDELNRVIIK